MGLSLLPSDLNSTNLLLSGIVDLLDEGLGTGESDTSDQVHTLYPFILCTKIEKIIRVYRVYSVLKFCLQLIFVTLVKNILAALALFGYTTYHSSAMVTGLGSAAIDILHSHV